MRIPPKVRNSQPQQGTRINNASSLAHKLAFVTGAAMRDAAGDSIGPALKGTSTLAYSEKGLALHGLGTATASTNASGLDFNTCPAATDIFNTGSNIQNGSVSFLLKMDQTASAMAIMSKSDNNAVNGWHIFYNGSSDNSLDFEIEGVSVNTRWAAAGTLTTAGKWYFVTINTLFGSGTSYTASSIEVFINGVLIPASDRTVRAGGSNINTTSDAAHRLVLGSCKFRSTIDLQGDLPFVCFHRRPITASEHIALYQNPWQLFEVGAPQYFVDTGGGGGTGVTVTLTGLSATASVGSTTAAQGFTLFTDNFNDGTIGAQWSTTQGTDATVAETGGNLVYSFATHGSASYDPAKLVSTSSYALTGQEIVVQIGSDWSGFGGFQLEFAATDPANSSYGYHFIVDWFNITAQVITSGGTTTVTTSGWSTANQGWLRIREAGGTIYFDTATRGTGVPGTWTNFASTTIDSALPTGSMKAKMTGALYDTTASAYQFKLDGFNTNTNSGIDVTLTGLAATASLGTPTVSGAANVTLTGLAATASLGSPTVAAKAGVTLSGFGTTASLGSPTVAANAGVTLSGFGTTASLGTTTQSGKAGVTLSGLAATSALGDVTVSAGGSVSVSLTGFGTTASLGTTTQSGAGNVTVTGLAGTTALGSVTPAGYAGVTVTGLAGTSGLGSVTASVSGGVTVDLSGLSAVASVGEVTIVGARVDVIVYLTNNDFRARALLGQVVAVRTHFGLQSGALNSPGFTSGGQASVGSGWKSKPLL